MNQAFLALIALQLGVSPWLILSLIGFQLGITYLEHRSNAKNFKAEMDRIKAKYDSYMERLLETTGVNGIGPTLSKAAIEGMEKSIKYPTGVARIAYQPNGDIQYREHGGDWKLAMVGSDKWNELRVIATQKKGSN